MLLSSRRRRRNCCAGISRRAAVFLWHIGVFAWAPRWEFPGKRVLSHFKKCFWISKQRRRIKRGKAGLRRHWRARGADIGGGLQSRTLGSYVLSLTDVAAVRFKKFCLKANLEILLEKQGFAPRAQRVPDGAHRPRPSPAQQRQS